jgi:hypothetical protein
VTDITDLPYLPARVRRALAFYGWVTRPGVVRLLLRLAIVLVTGRRWPPTTGCTAAARAAGGRTAGTGVDQYHANRHREPVSVGDGCPSRHKGVRCILAAPDAEGIHPGFWSTRHGGLDRRGVWHFWGTTLAADEQAEWLPATD